MDHGLVVVVGASGHIGKRVAEQLLEARRTVRVVARRAEALEPLARAGAEVMTGSIDDPGFASQAFAGAHAAFVMLPPVVVDADLRGHQNRVSESLVHGLRTARVRYVVNLSSWGAEVNYGTGPIAALHDHEERMDQLKDSHVIHLRAASFMENFLNVIPMIQYQKALLGTIRADLAVPYIATKDIAHEVYRQLTALDFEDKSTQELLGARDYTSTEAASILGASIGSPQLPYTAIPDQEMHMAFAGAGLPAHMIDMFLEMYRAIDSEKIHVEESRSPANTTATTFEDWAASDFAPAYRAATAS
jgi:uncharacterized protein YbjT (DUF2867 family)